MFFIDLTLANGQPLDIPAFAIMLLEEIDDDAKAANPGAQAGLFYDAGNGPQNALVRQTFPEIAEKLTEREQEFARLRLANDKPLMMLKSMITAIRGLSDEENMPGKTQLTFRLGQQALALHVNDTRDEIREKIDG